MISASALPRVPNSAMFNNPRGLAMATTEFQPTPLHRETRTAIPTHEAAFHLNRTQQTMRLWACKENGPIRPIRINGRLAWSVDALRGLLGGAV